MLKKQALGSGNWVLGKSKTLRELCVLRVSVVKNYFFSLKSSDAELMQ